jgi:hypothetical protein
MLTSMQIRITELPRPKEAKRLGYSEQACKNPQNRALMLPGCTLKDLGARCNTETTVMKRILRFPLPH